MALVSVSPLAQKQAKLGALQNIGTVFDIMNSLASAYDKFSAKSPAAVSAAPPQEAAKKIAAGAATDQDALTAYARLRGGFDPSRYSLGRVWEKVMSTN